MLTVPEQSPMSRVLAIHVPLIFPHVARRSGPFMLHSRQLAAQLPFGIWTASLRSQARWPSILETVLLLRQSARLREVLTNVPLILPHVARSTEPRMLGLEQDWDQLPRGNFSLAAEASMNANVRTQSVKTAFRWIVVRMRFFPSN
ncbi:hypothetical protein BQ8794_50487 [Mesorhizobium prunaredense]|uniref:Uncharacterized protein n=1 Tax=Mesorhizobium prunaredense TaxID=1631249 RepID=A0A1R3VEM4_9HYPH|nr:hypothetical protein BQ8794_50487 [Mesorhizobium prunaredense]